MLRTQKVVQNSAINLRYFLVFLKLLPTHGAGHQHRVAPAQTHLGMGQAPFAQQQGGQNSDWGNSPEVRGGHKDAQGWSSSAMGPAEGWG